MEKKEILVVDDGDLLLPLGIAGVSSLLMAYLFMNQMIMIGFTGVMPDLILPRPVIMGLFWIMGTSLVFALYLILTGKSVEGAGLFVLAGICVGGTSGELYDASLLIGALRDYSYTFILRDQWILGGVYWTYMFLAMFFLIKPPLKRSVGTHGTAEIQYGDHYMDDSPIGASGRLIIGAHLKKGKLLKYGGDRHLATMAPTGAGKGVGVIIPNLLNYPYSVITVDPKGENCNFTADHRERELGQQIICLDPFRESIWGKKNGTHHFNPLDGISTNFQDAFDPCMDIVDIVFTKEMTGDPFWINRAKNLYLGFLIYVCTAPEYNHPNHPNYSPELRNLSTINHLFSIPSEDLMVYIKKISISDLPLDIKKFANEILTAAASEKMLVSIMETLKSEIQIFHSPEISSVMSHSDFSYEQVITGRATIYLIIPSEKLEAYSKWIRVVITMFIRKAISIRKTNLAKANEEKVLFLLDEFANLGRLDVVRKAYSLVRGYGLKFWIIFQDLSQIQPLYKENWKSFFSNSGIIQVFGTNDIDTAEYISKTIGETTVVSVSKSKNKSSGQHHSSGRGTSRSEQKRRVMNADEVRRLPSNQQIILVEGENPILAKRIRYYSDPRFSALTPDQSEVFETINNLPAKFPIDDDTGTIEVKLRRLIRNHEYEQYKATDSDEKEAEREIEEHTQKEDIGDDFEITMF
ncbi:MAG: type IV secretory system conjugative DNA transfer family protein [Balneolaceae bacterium]|nr:type IV secretory system conjugative DNA transfer family protein [Balneolaceae bacterium]